MVAYRETASVLVVDDIGNMGQRSEWYATLKGLAVATPNYLTSSGMNGHILRFQPAVRIARLIWASPAFAERHAGLHDIITHSMDLVCNRWTWFEGTTEDVSTACRRTRGSRQMILLVNFGDKVKA